MTPVPGAETDVPEGLDPPFPPELQPDPTPPEPQEDGLLSSPWFWTAAAVIVAGGVTTAVVLSSESVADGYSGNLGQFVFQ